MPSRAGLLLLVLSCALAFPAVAAAAPPVNIAPPVIDERAPVVGDMLTASGDAWDDPAATVAYQWLRCASTCTDIAGATNPSYTVTADDVGNALQVRAIASNIDGSSLPSDSAPTDVVPPIAPQNTAPPAITGTAERGSRLTAQDGTWTGTPPLDVTRQWRRCDTAGLNCVDVAGATGPTLLLSHADENHTVRVRETASNAAGTATADSAPTAVVPAAPSNTAPPTITGTARRGSTLTAHDGTWTGTPDPGLTFQWRRCDANGVNCTTIAGATGSTRVLSAADEDHTLRVRQTAQNALGTVNADSAPTALVPVPVTNASPPLIEGSRLVGATLVSSIGDWSGTTPIVLTRRWQRCSASGCADIPGAVSDTYVVQPADLGKSIRLVIHASNDGGAVTAASALLGPVTAGSTPPPPPPPVVPPPTPGPSSPTALAAAFTAPKKADLARALAGKLKVRAECTGPCRLRVRLKASKAVARKWQVPRTLATGRRNLVAAGKATVRPKFARKTRRRLRSVETLVVRVVADARDGSGKVVSSRTFKVRLVRPAT